MTVHSDRVPTQVIPQQTTRGTVGRVTAATDGSYWGHAALDWGARYAASVGAELDVYEADRRYEDIPADVPADIGTGSVLSSYPLLPVRVRRCGRDPVTTLLSAATVSDLVVLGGRGHHRRHIGVGHNALTLAASARCDVVVVRGRLEAVRGTLRDVTALVSRSEVDDVVLLRAREFAARTRWGLRVVHAGDAIDAEPRFGISVEVQHRTPQEVVSDLAATGLLIVGHHRLPGSARLGLVTRAALHHAPCPVMVVRGAEIHIPARR